jgi:hypothetical protein
VKIKELILKTDSDIKHLIFVGETHIYSNTESKKAKDFLDKHNFDYGFVEGADIRQPARTLYNLYYKSMQLLTWRWGKTLIDLARESGISILRLEGKLPVKTEIGLSAFFLLFFLGPIILIYTLPMFSVLMRFVIILLMYIGLTNLTISRNDDIELISKNLPTNKEKRDEIMSSNLLKYIKEKDFKKALVVLGKYHLKDIFSEVEDNLKS